MSKIREINYGDFENTSWAQYEQANKDSGLDFRDFVCPGDGGESWNTFHDRVKGFLNDELIQILDTSIEDNFVEVNQSKSILVVAHGGTLLEMTNAFEQLIDPTYTRKLYGV